MAICGCTGGGVTTCEAIVACIRPYLGRGLRWNADAQRLEVCLSSDAGNTLIYGSDNCLYSPGGGTPPPDTGRKTIAGLPTFVCGARDCAALMAPPGSDAGIDHAISHNIDIIDAHCWSAADGVSVWAPYSATSPNQIEFYSTSPGIGGNANTISSSDFQNLFSDAGNPYNPCGNNNAAPTSLKPTGRDVNWYGWFAPTQYWHTAVTVLREISARAVVIMRTDGSTRDVNAAINAVNQVAGQTWVMISSYSGTDGIDDIINAGITPCFDVDNNTTTTPASLTALGIQWVLIRADQTTARIQSFIDAGLEVLVTTDSTQYQTAQFTAMGARGIMAWDPVYACNKHFADPTSMVGRDATYGTRTTKFGDLTSDTHSYGLLGARGFAHNDEPGRWEEVRYQWIGDTTRVNWATTLVGSLSPLPTGVNNYTLAWREKVPSGTFPSGTFAKVGVILCAADDRDWATTTASIARPGMNGYVFSCVIATGAEHGLLEAGRLDNGIFTSLGQSSIMRNWTIDLFSNFTLAVTPTQFVFTRDHPDGDYSMTVTDATYRGPYIFRMKEEGDTQQFIRVTDSWTLNNMTA